jgi:hypothetical protein
MALTVTYVPYGQLSYVLPKLVHNLQKSELWTKGRANIDDIVRFLYTTHMQLWAVHDPELEDVWGYVITEIKQYPKAKFLVMQYSAGDIGSLELSGDVVFETLEKFAKAEGCSGIEFFGRPGWRNHARKHGCTSSYVVYEKFFDGN